MSYARTPEQRAGDFAGARAFEEEVVGALGAAGYGGWHALDETDKLDFMHPGWVVEIKEKNQRINTQRWDTPTAERDSFIIDELSVRKAIDDPLPVFFVLRDNIEHRIFCVPLEELVGLPKRRMNRRGPTGHDKGKWIVSLEECIQLLLPNVAEFCHTYIVQRRGLRSECIGGKEVAQL